MTAYLPVTPVQNVWVWLATNFMPIPKEYGGEWKNRTPDTSSVHTSVHNCIHVANTHTQTYTHERDINIYIERKTET